MLNHTAFDANSFREGQFFLGQLQSCTHVQSTLKEVTLTVTAISIPHNNPQEFTDPCISFTYFCDQLSPVPITNNQAWVNYWHDKNLLFIGHPHSKSEFRQENEKAWFLDYPRDPSVDGAIRCDVRYILSAYHKLSFQNKYLVRARVKQMKPEDPLPTIEISSVLRTITLTKDYPRLTKKPELVAYVPLTAPANTLRPEHLNFFAMTTLTQTIQQPGRTMPNKTIQSYPWLIPNGPTPIPPFVTHRPPMTQTFSSQPPSPDPQSSQPSARSEPTTMIPVKPQPPSKLSELDETARGLRCPLSEGLITSAWRRKGAGDTGPYYEEEWLKNYIEANGNDPKEFDIVTIDDYEEDKSQTSFVRFYRERFYGNS
ncbi:hypothetical protein BLNAU_377 [Blattamonas nauphoetae]|uniref:Uncharacterized protein n=1 Tax=Blattamonas nauphoetae TaxID=2049346 RepID=A0ABQ9YLC0_9EUKA|nr:hypothetical protein BLNAU_377 [Blattamonas nauphoetae]